jgi:phospholipid-translocating ATPase
MIQEAHIGLGIFGKEGRNAARSADFAFAKFKHLRRALLVHGYLYYTRLSTLALYFFYKNLVFVTCQVFYAPSTAFSVQVNSKMNH